MTDDRPELPDGWDPSVPQITLSPRTVCCPAHGEHLRAHFPDGFLTVAVTIAVKALQGEALPRAARFAERRVDELGQAVDEVLVERPLCYFVDRATVRSAFLDAGILSIVLGCAVCGRSGPGGPYNVSEPTGTRTLRLCLECALDAGDRLHRAHPRGKVWPAE